MPSSARHVLSSQGIRFQAVLDHVWLYCDRKLCTSSSCSHFQSRHVDAFRTKTMAHKINTWCAPAQGVLKEGRQYYVHRVLLYSDDFQPYVSRKGSYGGVYFLPVTDEKEADYSAVRVLGLSPPGASSNSTILD